jgi:uncharacterized membrane protein
MECFGDFTRSNFNNNILDMAGKTEEINIKVKSDIKDATKDAKGLASEFEIMGVSLNTLKSSFAKIIPIAKKSFATIKAGIMSTGIGVLVIALGSVITYLTQTKKGAEILEKGLKVVGTTISVITDRVSKFGGAVIKFFKGDFKGAAEDAKASVSGVVEEIKEEVKETIKMVGAQQKLRDAQRDLNVETAKSVAFIEQQKLIAEDVTKTFDEREKAAKTAFAREQELENKRIKLAEENLRLKKQEVGMGESMAEDLDALAEAEIELANIKQESAGRQISLQNFLNGLRATEKAEKDAEIEEEKARKEEEAEAEKERILTEAEELRAIREENMLLEIEDLRERALKKLEIEKEAELERIKDYENFQELKAEIDKKYGRAEKELEIKKVEWADITTKQKLDLAKGAFQNMAKILGEETKAGQAMAIMGTTISTFQSATESYKSLAGIPIVGPALGAIAAGAAIAMGLKNIQAIKSAKPGASGGGGGGSMSAGAGGGGTPAPEMLSGAFDLSGVNEPEPVKAFVVTDDMTNSQDKLANIRRRATI